MGSKFTQDVPLRSGEWFYGPAGIERRLVKVRGELRERG